MMRFAWCVCVVSAAAVAFGETVVTSPDVFEVAISGDVTIAPVTVEVTAEPADLPTPVFHFDATRSDDWTFDAQKTTVSKIPSLVGDHYLTASEGVADWQIGNGSKSSPLYLASVEELGGKPAISFGDAVNTLRSLWFDPVDAGEDGTVTNILRNIGTVVAVHRMLEDNANTFLGGGFVMGSAWGATDTTCRGNNWSRDTSSGLGSAYWSPMFYGYRGPMGGNWAFHDGLKTDPTAAGFSGKWEVTIFQPKEAKWEANGIGFTVVPSMAYNRGGGQWAELYVFDTVVDEDVLQRLNAYLQRKWFGDEKTGYNGAAHIGRLRSNMETHTSAGATNVVDVSTGMTLTIDRLSGGRGFGAKLLKRGAGALKVIEAANFGGDIELEAGRLDLTTKAVPLTRDELPSGLSYAFDASDRDSMTLEDDGKYLRRWRNGTTCTVKSGSTIYARAMGNADARRPEVLPDALGAGLNVLDFGRYNTANTTDEAKVLDFVYSSDGTTFTAFNPQSVYTVVAVMGAQRSGGNIVAKDNASTFSRHQSMVDWMADSSFTAEILRTAETKPSYANVYPITNSCVMINGTVVDSQKGYETPGYQVVGIRTSAQSIQYIGGTSVRRGGLRLGELLIWQRPLTDEEIRDAQAYLTKKWFKRDLAGYHSAGHALADARSVVAAGPSEIYVPAGTTARVEALTADATVVKTGAGTLEVGPFGSTGAGSLKLVEGTVRAVAAQDVVTDASAPAAGASMHLDASDAKSVYYKPGTATYEVQGWYDKANNNTAYNYDGNRSPICNTSATGPKLNGLPIMDLMPDETKRALYFGKSLDGIRAAFVVWKPADGGCILGCQSKRDANGYRLDFCRASGGKELIIYNQGADVVRRGQLFVNGVQPPGLLENYIPESEFQLMELYPATASHASALGLDRGDYRGSCQYAEIILYERELSDREKVATRNYLMKKWFNADPEKLPPAQTAVLPGNLAFADGTALTVTRRDDGMVEPIASVSGTLSFGRNLTLNLVGFDPERDLGKKFVIAHAAEYAGLDDLKAATVTGLEIPTGCTLKFRATADGDLVMKLAPDGTLLLVR